jgi:hypothetical protein
VDRPHQIEDRIMGRRHIYVQQGWQLNLQHPNGEQRTFFIRSVPRGQADPVLPVMNQWRAKGFRLESVRSGHRLSGHFPTIH